MKSVETPPHVDRLRLALGEFLINYVETNDGISPDDATLAVVQFAAATSVASAKGDEGELQRVMTNCLMAFSAISGVPFEVEVQLDDIKKERALDS